MWKIILRGRRRFYTLKEELKLAAPCTNILVPFSTFRGEKMEIVENEKKSQHSANYSNLVLERALILTSSSLMMNLHNF